MTAWQFVFRNGFAPQLSTAGLTVLRTALAAGDARLLAGATTMPPPLQCVQGWPVEACCPISFAGWQGNGLVTVAEVEEFFARACFEADQALGETAACRWFLNWWDTTPLAEARPLLLAEVDAELARRTAGRVCPLTVRPAPTTLVRGLGFARACDLQIGDTVTHGGQRAPCGGH